MKLNNVIYSPILDLRELFTKSQQNKIFKLIGISARLVDLLYYFPFRYVKYQELEDISDVFIDTDVIIQLKVIKHIKALHFGRKKTAYKIITATRNENKVILTFFQANQLYLQKFEQNKVIKIRGRLKMFKENFTISHPSLIDTKDSFKSINLEDSCGIITKYPLIQGITNTDIQKIMQIAVNVVAKNNISIEGEFCKDFIQNNLKSDLQNIHFPLDEESLSASIKRFSFEEFLASYLAITFARKSVDNNTNIIIKSKNILSNSVLENFKYKLTQDQETAVSDIRKMHSSGKKDFRLIQGDVGSGKTIVSFISCADIIESGYQAIILAPTTILAMQHYELALRLFFGTNTNIELITSKITAKKRKDIISKFRNGEIDLLVGTHSLFSEEIVANKLGLIVIDEQHRFGVNQRISLVEKAMNCHTIMMSATPIPRTLIMGIYGDINISEIHTKPEFQKPIKTSVISSDKYIELIEHIKKKINNNERIYWVCPLIDSEDIEGGVYFRLNDLSKHIQMDNIAILHGKMKEDEKNNIIMQFKRGEKKVLISTTVVEVGVNVPEATIMVIESPERFGLSQLHQLRGRVGRGELQSFCILYINDDIAQESLDRLAVIKNNIDGMEIAKYDMKMRGYGKILGTEQSGETAYRIANINRDFDLISQTAKFAKQYCTMQNIQSNIEVYKLVNHVMRVFCNDEFEKYIKA